MTNIPIHRAETTVQNFKEETESLKKINGIWYAIGFYSPIFFMCMGNERGHYIHGEDGYQYDIKLSTLAIHHKDMIDSEGAKIFASLSEDSKGGDTIVSEQGHEFVYKYRNNKFVLWNEQLGHYDMSETKNYFKVTGIQRWI